VKLALAVLLFVGLDVPMLLRSGGALAGAPWSVPREVASDPGALRMEVLARQWTWEGRFPGSDGIFATPDDVVTRGELRVPADRPVILQMASADVVHALHAPGLRIQRDIVPGHLAHAWFFARRQGSFDVRCAQFCGASHAAMVAPLRILSSDEHDAWLAEAAGRALRASHDGSASEGDGGSDDLADPAGWGWTWREASP
jgi:cytochrome c oxidase subunit 2